MGNQVLVATEGARGILTLNLPKRHNSLTPDFLESILIGINELNDNPEVKVILLKAEGISFSTGGDVRVFRERLADISLYSEEIVGALNQVMIAMVKISIPIITCVQGMVTGGSLGLVLASDIILVTHEASFTPYYSVVGFSPDGGWATILPRIIGQKRAAEVLLLNETITAEKAVLWGLANRLVDKEELFNEARKIANVLIENKTGSIARTKNLLWQDIDQLERLLEKERQQFVEQIQTDEARVGLQAFLRR
ncbi:enoyl-CoA hydratase/isomerase family protein [bacterium]|nr:enoyl-CoA hydratase/isomerase family protein [bacterium]